MATIYSISLWRFYGYNGYRIADSTTGYGYPAVAVVLGYGYTPATPLIYNVSFHKHGYRLQNTAFRWQAQP